MQQIPTCPSLTPTTRIERRDGVISTGRKVGGGGKVGPGFAQVVAAPHRLPSALSYTTSSARLAPQHANLDDTDKGRHRL